MPPLPARGPDAIKPLNELTATEIVAAIGQGRTTCEAVARACLDRIAAREGEVHAWAHLDPEAALAVRPRLRQGRQARPARRRAVRRQGHHRHLRHADRMGHADPQGPPARSATPPASRCRARPAASCSARPSPPNSPTCIPARPAIRTTSPARPAGSSSGSAAAVADFMVPIAIGTQTTGSTIRPASFCGVFGYRPTYGEHRMHGVMEASGSLDTLGILSRSVADIALYRDVLLGIPPEPMPTIAAAALRALPQPRLGSVRAGDPHADRGRRASGLRAPAPASPNSPCPPNSSCSTTRTARSRASSSPAPSPGRSRTTGTRSATRFAAAGCTTASPAASSATSRQSSSRTNAADGSTR